MAVMMMMSSSEAEKDAYWGSWVRRDFGDAGLVFGQVKLIDVGVESKENLPALRPYLYVFLRRRFDFLHQASLLRSRNTRVLMWSLTRGQTGKKHLS